MGPERGDEVDDRGEERDEDEGVATPLGVSEPGKGKFTFGMAIRAAGAKLGAVCSLIEEFEELIEAEENEEAQKMLSEVMYEGWLSSSKSSRSFWCFEDE